jgi:hypothetical protein
VPKPLPRSDDWLIVARTEAGIGHWQKTLARHVWLLRRAGVPSVQIERQIARSLRQCSALREAAVPAADEHMVSRIRSHWRHVSTYLDNKGQPRALPLDGRSPTFRSLVRAAAPGMQALTALAALKSYHLVSHTQGLVRLHADGLFPYAAAGEPLLSVTLTALDALTDTCYLSPHARQPSGGFSRIQRTVYTNYLDPRSRRAYREFLTESAQVFLAMHESWLKRHEVLDVDPQRKPSSRIGVGVFEIRGR